MDLGIDFTDERSLSCRLKSVSLRMRPRWDYKVRGLARDGWVTSQTRLQIRQPYPGKELLLCLEVSPRVKLRLPLRLQALSDGILMNIIEIAHPGVYSLTIPLDKAVSVQLKPDRWAGSGTGVLPSWHVDVPWCRLTSVTTQTKTADKPAEIDTTNQAFAPYHILGRSVGGWMAPEALIQIDRAGVGEELALTVEIPVTLPFRFPLRMDILGDGALTNVFDFACPGIYQLSLPLVERILFELKTDQWFDPAIVGMPVEQPKVSYRVLKAAINEVTNRSALYEVLGRGTDGWMSPVAAVNIKQAAPGAWLSMTLEIPAGLPFRYPLKLKAVRDSNLIEEIEFNAAGGYEVLLPLGREGLIRLQADQWLRPTTSSGDDRKLSYRLLNVNVRKTSNPYEILRWAPDGSMRPDLAAIQIYRTSVLSQLIMALDVPAGLPFQYPLTLQALKGCSVVRKYKLNRPGRHQIELPLNETGLIRLKSDQWFDSLESGADQQLSYRLLETKIEAKSAIHKAAQRLLAVWNRLKRLKSYRAPSQ
jgi:hypothetical protein